MIGKPLLGGKKIKIPSIGGSTKPAAADTSALIGAPPSVGGVSTAIKNPMKVGNTGMAMKTPKSKKLPDATDKPSVFYKSEGLPKHPTTIKLRDFLDKKHRIKK